MRPPRILLLCALLLGAAPPTHAGGAAHGALVFEKPSYDFGVVDQDRAYEADVRYRNRGDAPIRGITAHAGCSCFGATLSATELAPGAAGTAHVTFRTYSFRGRVRKSLRLRYPGGEAVLELRLDVVGGVLVSRLYFGEVLAGTLPEGSTEVGWYVGVGHPFHVLGVKVPGQDLAVRIEPWEVHARVEPPPADPQAPREKVTYRGYRLHFRFTRPPPKGVFSAKALVRTDHPDHPLVRVPLTANVVGKVWVQTSRIYLGLIPRGHSKSASVTFRGFDASIHLGAVSAHARKGVLKVAIDDAPGGSPGARRLTVTAPADAPPGPLDDVVELHTEVPGERVVEIRVLGRIFVPEGR